MELTKEQELILEFAKYDDGDKKRIEELIVDKLDWCYVLGYLAYNRLSGMAYKMICSCNTPRWKINREFMLSLYMSYEAQKIRCDMQNKLVKELSDELEKTKLKYAFLKGTITSSMLYEEGERSSSDIDILINAEDITQLGRTLKSLGYVQGWYNVGEDRIIEASRDNVIKNRLLYGEIVPYVKKIDIPGYNVVKVDVNFSLDWRSKNIDKVVKQFLDNTILYKSVSNGLVRTLKNEYFLLHLLCHFYKEAYLYEVVEKQRDLCLYKAVDIYLFIRKKSSEINWYFMKEIVEIYELEKAVYYSLNILIEIYPILKNDNYLVCFMAEMVCENDNYCKEVFNVKDQKLYYWEKDVLERFFDMYRATELCEK